MCVLNHASGLCSRHAQRHQHKAINGVRQDMFGAPIMPLITQHRALLCLGSPHLPLLSEDVPKSLVAHRSPDAGFVLRVVCEDQQGRNRLPKPCL